MICNLTADWLTVSVATSFTERCVDVQVKLFQKKFAMYVSAKEQSLAVRKSNVRSQPYAAPSGIADPCHLSATVGAATAKRIRGVSRRATWTVERASTTEWVWGVSGRAPRAIEGATTSEGIRRVSGGATRTIESAPSSKWVRCVGGCSTWAGIRAPSSEWVGSVGGGAARSVEGPAAAERIRGVSGLRQYRTGCAQQQDRQRFHGCPFHQVWTCHGCSELQAHRLSHALECQEFRSWNAEFRSWTMGKVCPQKGTVSKPSFANSAVEPQLRPPETKKPVENQRVTWRKRRDSNPR